MTEADDVVRIGTVVGTFGLKGALKIQVETDFTELLEPGRTVLFNGGERTIVELKWHKKQARVWLEGVKKIDQAEALVGAELTAPFSSLPPLEDDTYLVRDLLGIEVFDEAGNRLGTLDEVYSRPAQDVYRIGRMLVPAVKQFVLSVDMEKRRMTVRVLPGMEDLA